MAPHSSILAWKIPWSEEPGGPQSTGSQRVWATEHTHKAYSLNYRFIIKKWDSETAGRKRSIGVREGAQSFHAFSECVSPSQSPGIHQPVSTYIFIQISCLWVLLNFLHTQTNLSYMLYFFPLNPLSFTSFLFSYWTGKDLHPMLIKLVR